MYPSLTTRYVLAGRQQPDHAGVVGRVHRDHLLLVDEVHVPGRDAVGVHEPALAVLHEPDTCSSATPRVTAANPSTSSHGLG